MSHASQLRRLLAEPGPLVLPGVYDGLSARLAAEAGFQALYLSGSAVAMSQFAYPDIGLLTMTEMLEQARKVIGAVGLPLVVDVDTGYGNALNVWRTVREAEASGIAGIQIEDQVSPKRCGHFEGKEVIPVGEMVGKIRAAIDARSGQLVIVARTDARAVNGLDDAIARAQAYDAAGADVIFLEAPQSHAELETIAASVKAHLLLNIVEGGKTPQISVADAEQLGFKIILYPTASVRAAAKSLRSLFLTLRERGSTAEVLSSLVTFEERNQINGLERCLKWAKEHSGEAGDQ